MDSFSIGISGLTVSQKALDVIGNNIANAATEGYHKQRIELTPGAARIVGEQVFGGGVEVSNISRIVDRLLEQEILRSQSLLAQTDRELDSLKTVEISFGDITEGGIGSKIDDFFDAMQDLATHPTNSIYQEQAITAGQAMTREFNSLGAYFNNLNEQLMFEASNIVDQINQLSRKIAELNGTIEDVELRGRQASNMRDIRDKCLTDLASLISIQTVQRENGIVDVAFNGTTIVSNRSSLDLAVKIVADDKIGITPKGDSNYETDISGGVLGGLFALKNTLLPGYKGDIDKLAQQVIQKVNEQHLEGVGSSGSFTQFTGWEMIDQDVADFNPPVQAGKIYVRIIDQATGAVTRESIEVDTTETLSEIAAKFDSIDGLTASVVSGALHIEGDTGFKFDFLPAVLSEPSTSTLTGTGDPTISGVYEGNSDETFTCTVIGSGRISVDSGLELEIRNKAGQLVKTVNVGQGYEPDTKISVGNGLFISFNAGTLIGGQNFTVDAIAESDQTGLLASAGINSFFSGNTAANIKLVDRIVSDPSLIATASTSEMNDNKNAQKIASLGSSAISMLGNKSFSDYFKTILSDVGQDIEIRTRESSNLNGMVQNLVNQQDSISGVNINDEAAQMLVYQRMFEAVGKYMAAVKGTYDQLLALLD